MTIGFKSVTHGTCALNGKHLSHKAYYHCRKNKQLHAQHLADYERECPVLRRERRRANRD